MARSGCIYGSSGSWKTTQVKFFSHYIAETTGKSTLLLSADGGGWSTMCDPEVEAGMILPFRCDPAIVPLPTLRRISQGYWPADTSLPANQIDLVPMDFDKVGGIAVEGWTSISSVAMRYLPDRGINVGGEEREKLGGFAQTIRISSEMRTETFRSNTRGDYNFVQNFLYGLTMNFISLPVRYVLFTALESRTEDDDRTTAYGPAIAGKKATSQCGAWVGDLIHAQDYPIERVEQVPDPAKPGHKMDQRTQDVVVRCYYRKHLDPVTGIPFPAKPRVTPERIKQLEKEFPGGYFEPDTLSGLDRYLKTVDQLATEPTDSLKDWRVKMDAKIRGVKGPVAVAK